MKTNTICGAACFALLALSASAAQSDLITLVHTGTGSGTLDGVAFSDVEFSITAFGNTDDRLGSGDVFFIVHESASIFIDGIGNLAFTVATSTFVSNSIGTVGFGRALGSDLFDGPFNETVFETWDMLTSIGPVSSDNGQLAQWADSGEYDIFTDKGHLVFHNEVGITTSFAAIVVPAPAGMFVLFGGVVLCSRGRRGQ